MATTPSPFELDIPGFGKVPVQANHDPERDNPVEITHRPIEGQSGRVSGDPRWELKDRRIALVNPGEPIPQYAVRKQKLVTLTPEQYDKLKGGQLTVGTTKDGKTILKPLLSISRELKSRVIDTDCPDTNSEGNRTVLLDWDEETDPDTFPELIFQEQQQTIQVEQINNFLVLSGKDGPNDPPARPPANAGGSLNNELSDFKLATAADLDNYRAQGRQEGVPVVAVMDTGLKFNLESPEWPHEHKYRDADGQERHFTIAFQDEDVTGCANDALSGEHLGYCALLSYRNSWGNDAAKSPFDDYRLFQNPNDSGNPSDARHGTFVSAIIQQNGDDAPVLPVKVFDNVGFATLFDVLNGFNYILHRADSANIRVVNASWICFQNFKVIRDKIEQLGAKGIFVVAAAGNEGQTPSRDLNDYPVYPACYSEDLPNVITVTSVRKTYFRPKILAPKQDSIIGKILSSAIKVGLFPLLEGTDDLVGAVLPKAGYVAVENYSRQYVNVGVVSTFGYFRSPFWKSPIIRGSSFACGFVSGFIVRQLLTNPDVLASVEAGDMAGARETLLEAMHGNNPDENLANEYVRGGHYLNGYAVD